MARRRTSHTRDVSGLTKWVMAIAAGIFTSALTSGGGVEGWGGNGYGQLADGRPQAGPRL